MSKQTTPVVTPEQADVLLSLRGPGAVVQYATERLRIPVTIKSVRRATASGDLKHGRVGKAFSYSPRAVRQWLSQWPLPGETE